MKSKEELWQAEQETVNNLADRIGRHTEKGARDAVIALRLLGVNATYAQTGSAEWNRIPYIEVISLEGLKIEQTLKDKRHRLLSLEQQLLYEEYWKLLMEDTWEETNVAERGRRLTEINEQLNSFAKPNEGELKETYKQILEANDIEAQKAVDLLDEFYVNRDTSEDARLNLHSYYLNYARIQSTNDEIFEKMDQSQKEHYIELFQDEMNAFTDFLKDKFFNKS